MKKCPKCGCERFYVTAHVVEEWLVDANGDYIETTAPNLEVAHYPNNEDIWICKDCGYDSSGDDFEIQEEPQTKLKIYEVERVRNDGKDEYKLQFWYLDYAEAVGKFKKLVAEEKKVDWIAEALVTKNDEHYESELREELDYWCVTVDYYLDCMYSAVTITEREVL